MMRKKAVQNLDSRQLTLIENAFFYCNPPEKQKVRARPVCIRASFIHHTIKKNPAKKQISKGERVQRETKRFIDKH